MRRIWAAAIFLFSTVTICQATNISLQTVSDDDAWSADSWVTVEMDYSAAYPGLFGSDSSETLLIYMPESGAETRSALEFSISALPSNIIIESAELWLIGGFFDQNIAVHAYSGNGLVDFNDFFVNALGTQIATFDPGPTNIIDVTNRVRSLYASGTSFAGFQLRELALDDPTLLFSSQDPESTLRPRLDIVFTPVPEPSTFILLGAGLAGLVAWRRKRS